MNRRINTLAYLRSPDCAEELRSAIDATDLGRLDIRMVGARPPDAFAPPAGAEVIVVELDTDAPSSVEALARLMKGGAEGRPVIVVARNATIALVRELMRSGVLDVLPRPVTAGDLANALTHARTQVEEQRPAEGKVVTVLRSCGGIGGTTLAVQTALELAGHGRGPKARVCLADFDLQFGSAALALDMAGNAGMLQILDAPARLDGAFVASAVARHASGLDVLAAPPEIVPFDTLTPDMAVRILSLLRGQYDFVVVDMPHAWTAWTAPVLSASALVALVMRLDVTGVLRARSHLKLIADEQVDDIPRLIVANQVEAGSAGKRRLKDAQAALGQTIDACVRTDAKAAADAREAGKPLREIAPDSVIVKDAQALVGQMLAILTPAAPEAPEAPRSALRRLFSLSPLGGSGR